MQWVLFILVVYVNEQLLSASMDILCRVHGGFVQVKDADYISCHTAKIIVLVQSISCFIYFYYFITFHCISLAVEGDQTTTDPYIFQLAWDLYNQGAIQSS